jgi:dUTP pyrophosphatase
MQSQMESIREEILTVKDSVTLFEKDLTHIKEIIQVVLNSQQSLIDNRHSSSEESTKFQSILNNQEHILDHHGKLITNALLLTEIASHPIIVKLLTPKATIPQKATAGSAGFDLYAAEDVTIKNNNIFKPVKTGIVMKIPSTHCGKICSRSGLTLNQQIIAFDGTIDADYQQEIVVLLKNGSNSPYKVSIGDKIAQIIFPKLHGDFAVQVTSIMDESTRGGFGSTGK